LWKYKQGTFSGFGKAWFPSTHIFEILLQLIIKHRPGVLESQKQLNGLNISFPSTKEKKKKKLEVDAW